MNFSNPVPIKASARLIYHLGEQLISDELVAILELIKNSYDADATSVQVVIDNNVETKYGKGKITIIDNGNGMLPSIIVNGFLRLATNYKKINKFSPYYTRKTLGEKGLGRLSFQRLGKYIEVETMPRLDRLSIVEELDKEYIITQGFNSFNIQMDWEGFADDADFEEITANVTPIIQNEIKYGTYINIYGIRNSNFWILNREKRERLQSEILSMTNPFISEKSDDKFKLKVDINGEKFLVDTIEEKIVNQLSDVSVNFRMDNGILEINSEIKEKYFNRLKDEYIQEQKSKKLELEDDFCYYNDYKSKNVVIDFNKIYDVRDKIPWIKEDIFNKINNNYAVDFSFSGSFYAVDKSAANRTTIAQKLLEESIYIQKNFVKIGKLWDKIAGIYMYRDNFRILPYGKLDWLGFTKLSQQIKATIFKSGNVAGYIQIDGGKSELLKEQTNRQGILLDEYGYNFITILSRVVTEQVFRWDINTLRSNFAKPKEDKNSKFLFNADKSIKFKQLINVEQVFKKQEKEFDEIFSAFKVNNSQLSLFIDPIKIEAVEKAIEFKKLSTEYNTQLNQKINVMNDKLMEYKEIIPLIGQSIIIETVTHEFYRIYQKLSSSLKSLDTLISDDINMVESFKIKLIKIQQDFRREINGLDLQLNHIAPTHRNKLKDEVDLDIKNFLIENYFHDGVISNRLKEKGILCIVNGTSFVSRMSVGNAIVIFDNIVLNSEYWLEKHGIENPAINFDIKFNQTITIWDNGKGIDPIIENILFDPFKSQKTMGRGLGLYIVQELLAIIGANIELLDDRNDSGNRYKFQINFTGE